MQARRTYLLAFATIVSFFSVGQEFSRQQLDSIVYRAHREKLPGFAVRVMKGDELLYASGAGMANIHRQLPMGQTSVTNIGSVTKQFTAYAIFLLEERGKLKLSDEIHTYVPELTDFGAPITLEQLMAHTSGLRDYPSFLSILNESTNRRLKFGEMLEFLQTHKELNFPPGSRFCYSNTGYMLLAEVIERVSGVSYSAFLQQEVFTPLGMSATFVNEDVLLEQTDGTRAYILNTKKTKAYTSRAHRDVVGATGIYSNLEDLAKWNAFLYRHESGMFPKPVIGKMETSFRLGDGSSCNYGGGLILKKYRGKPVVEHSGGWGEYLTQCRRFPDSGISILIVTNSQLDSPFELCDKLSNALLDFDDDLTVQPKQFTAGSQLADLGGTYLSENNLVRLVNVQSDRQSVRIGNPARSGYATYFLSGDAALLANLDVSWILTDSAGNELSFRQEYGERSVVLNWSAGGYFHAPQTYQKLAVPSTDIAAYCGRFYSREADKTIRIRLKRGTHQLELHPSPFMKQPMKQLGEGVFQVKGKDAYVIRFTENGLVFGNDWINGLVFEKR